MRRDAASDLNGLGRIELIAVANGVDDGFFDGQMDAKDFGRRATRRREVGRAVLGEIPGPPPRSLLSVISVDQVPDTCGMMSTFNEEGGRHRNHKRQPATGKVFGRDLAQRGQFPGAREQPVSCCPAATAWKPLGFGILDRRPASTPTKASAVRYSASTH